MIKPIKFEKIKQDSVLKFFVAYDIESMQLEVAENTFKHVPILVAMIVCDNCCDSETKLKYRDPCNFCGTGKYAYYGEGCVKEFGDHLYKLVAKRACDKSLFLHTMLKFMTHSFYFKTYTHVI